MARQAVVGFSCCSLVVVQLYFPLLLPVCFRSLHLTALIRSWLARAWPKLLAQGARPSSILRQAGWSARAGRWPTRVSSTPFSLFHSLYTFEKALYCESLESLQVFVKGVADVVADCAVHRLARDLGRSATRVGSFSVSFPSRVPATLPYLGTLIHPHTTLPTYSESLCPLHAPRVPISRGGAVTPRAGPMHARTPYTRSRARARRTTVELYRLSSDRGLARMSSACEGGSMWCDASPLRAAPTSIGSIWQSVADSR